jgi:DNA-binding SARP family transcriptional activator
MEIVTAEGVVTPRGKAARTVMAVLLSEANHSVGYDRLADALWRDELPQTWLKTLQTHVSHLRSLIGPGSIDRRGEAYVLEVEPELVDAHQFEQLETSARASLQGGDPEPCRRQCLEALGLWRGEPYGDAADNEILQLEVMRLDEIRLTIIELCFEADLDLGRHLEVVGALEAAVVQFPYRERLRRAQIRALARSGRRAEATQASRAYGKMLVDEAGVDPGAELAELEQEIQHPGR